MLRSPRNTSRVIARPVHPMFSQASDCAHSAAMSHQHPTGKGAMVKRRSANKAMELMQTRLRDLTKRCNKFSAKYAKKPEDIGPVDDSISVIFRSLVSGKLDKATPRHCLATCTCLHTACFSHGKASACSNAALADDTASSSAKGCSCSTCIDTAAPGAETHHIARAASSEGSRMGNHVSSCRSKQHAGRANLWNGGECHAHAIPGRTELTRCSGRDSQQGCQGLSHRQVLQQGIVQLQQQLAHERDMLVQHG